MCKKRELGKVKEERKSGLVEDFDNIFNEINYEDFLSPYTTFSKELGSNLAHVIGRRCYVVTYKEVPGLIYVAFESNKDRAKGTATRYFKLSGHPMFAGRLWRDLHKSSRGVLKPDWDRYINKGKIPVKELLKYGVSFPCALCGKHIFRLEDLEAGRCIIVEGEGDINPFTEGMIVCKHCI